MESCERVGVISSLLCHRRAIGIPCLIWMILTSLCHICLVYQLMNCWMCLRLLDLLKGREEATAFSVQSTHHTVLQFTPGQLVFRCDMMLNIPFIAIWGAIRRRKQQLIEKITNQKIKIANCIHIEYGRKY